MHIPEDVFGSETQQAYRAAKDLVVRTLQEQHTPPALAGDPQHLAAYRTLDRRSARLRFSIELLLMEEAPFEARFRGGVHDPTADIVVPVDVLVPGPVVTAVITGLALPHRTAVANRFIAPNYHKVNSVLGMKNITVGKKVRALYVEQRRLLRALYERLVDDRPEAA